MCKEEAACVCMYVCMYVCIVCMYVCMQKAVLHVIGTQVVLHVGIIEEVVLVSMRKLSCLCIGQRGVTNVSSCIE